MSTIKEHRINIKNLEQNSKKIHILQEIYRMNKEDIRKVNNNLIKIVADPEILLIAYEKIRKNKGAFTPGTEPVNPEKMNLIIIEEIGKQIREGKYEWKPIRRKMIPKPGKKKKRPLGVVNFIDKMVQEAIRMVLTCIYEPIFQVTESNHGFRPSRSTETCITHIQRRTKEMNWVLEGDVKGAYDNVDHKIMMEILKEKITDKKFLKLIKSGLEQKVLEEDKKLIRNLVGTPQGSIASPIIFNIYMQKFDEEILKKIEEIKDNLNSEDKRTINGKYSREYKRYSSRIEKAKIKLNRKDLTKKESLELIERIRDSKKRQLKTVGKLKDTLKIRMEYARYADDWIIITNAKKETVVELKKWITSWLQENLKLQLDQEKTIITNLMTEKCNFLGFSLFNKKKRIIKKKSSSGKIYRQRSTVPVTIGIDHNRVIERLKNIKFIDSKTLKPRANGVLSILPAWKIVEHLNQRMLGLTNYYYRNITYKNELNRYHYILRFCLLHTLAKRQKTFLKKVTLKYGYNLIIKYNVEEKNQKGEKVVKERFVKFMTLSQMHKTLKTLTKKKDSEMYKNMKKNKETEFNYLPRITFSNLLDFENTPEDPFSKNLYSVNLRSAYQLTKYCSVCGKRSKKTGDIEMHHLKHVRKGKLSGFNQLLQQINRKQIPVCKPCHNKIHTGKYDGHDLSMIYDPNIIIA